ncbi:MAG: hypothetical protein WBM44_26895 [Waterburya sp.]
MIHPVGNSSASPPYQVGVGLHAAYTTRAQCAKRYPLGKAFVAVEVKPTAKLRAIGLELKTD